MGLFDYSRFVPRHHCGDWEPAYIWLYVIASATIAISYFGIAGTLFWAAKRNVAFQPPNEIVEKFERNLIRIVYAAFIISCGIGHIEGVMAFKWPTYHAFAVWHSITAVISAYAFYTTWRIRKRLPDLL